MIDPTALNDTLDRVAPGEQVEISLVYDPSEAHGERWSAGVLVKDVEGKRRVLDAGAGFCDTADDALDELAEDVSRLAGEGEV